MAYQWDPKSEAWLQPGDERTRVVQARCMRLAPEKYPASSMPREFWLDTFQDSLRELLESYLNGNGLSWHKRLLQCPMETPQGLFKFRLQKVWHLATEKLQAGNINRFQASVATVPEHFICLYELLEKQIALSQYERAKTSVYPAGDDCLGPHRHLAIIKELFSEAEPSNRLKSTLLVQGSVGTGEQIGYSDLDLWMIVSRETLAEPAKLKKLAIATFRINRCLFAYDSLQHHGVMLSTWVDLQRYRESYLPIDAIVRAASLSPRQDPVLVFCPTPSSVGSGVSFLNILSALRHIVEKATDIQTPYALKSVLSGIMLLPALFEGAMGRPCFKGDSFKRVEIFVPDNIWSIMIEISAVRKCWNYRPPLLVNLIQAYVNNPFVFQYLMQREFSGRLHHVSVSQLPEYWQQRALVLAEYLWKRLCQSLTTS